MGGSSLSPAVRAWLFCAVTAVHAGLLAAMASTAAAPDVPIAGGAPVINLTLVPSPRLDGRNGAEGTAGRPVAPAPGGQAPPAPDEFRPPERLRPAMAETVESPAPSPTGPVAPALAAGPASLRVGTIRTGDAPADSRAGQTEGGGAPTVGAAAAPLEDRYAAEVIAWVEQHKRGPGRRLSGVAVLRFVLDRQGRLRESAVVSASGDRRVGPIALDALRSAEPFPRPPTNTHWRTREFHVRLDYRPEG